MLGDSPVAPSTSEPDNTPSNSKSNEDVAREVIQDLWGNGSDRKSRLEIAGYDYQAVQNRVNGFL